jgi:hypothetical protein
VPDYIEHPSQKLFECKEARLEPAFPDPAFPGIRPDRKRSFIPITPRQTNIYKRRTRMKFNKIITVIIVLAVILISLDFITLTDRWRFLGWEIFF